MTEKYEVYFMDCCGNFYHEESFDSFEEADAYVEAKKEYLSFEEDMFLKKVE